MRAGTDVVPMRRMRPLLGTWVEMRVDGPADRVEAAVDAAFAQIAGVQERMSCHDPRSALSRINLQAHRSPQQVDAWTWRVLRLALALSRASGGLFDVTVGGELVRRGVLPDHGFGAVEPRGGSGAVELLPGRRVRLRRPVVLTLDGIAKGYAVDRAVRALRACGVAQGVVNAGGDLRAFGAAAVPLALRDGRGRVRAVGQVANAAVASSIVGQSAAQRERFPACLVLPDAAGGVLRPAHRGAGPAVWTVQARHCWKADALTKVAALAASDRRAACIDRLGGRLLADPAPDRARSAA